MIVIGPVMVIAPVIVAALGNWNDTLIVIKPVDAHSRTLREVGEEDRLTDRPGENDHLQDIVPVHERGHDHDHGRGHDHGHGHGQGDERCRHTSSLDVVFSDPEPRVRVAPPEEGNRQGTPRTPKNAKRQE